MSAEGKKLVRAKAGPLAAFKCSIPYSAEAWKYIPGYGMEDGYKYETDYGEVRVQKGAANDAMRVKYKMLSRCVMTPLGLVDVETGDYIMDSAFGKFVITEKQYRILYEEVN